MNVFKHKLRLQLTFSHNQFYIIYSLKNKRKTKHIDVNTLSYISNQI